MPVYSYRCENCGHEFDRHQSFSDDALKACPKCKKRALQKVYRPAGVVFKGSGYYVTDKKKTASTTNGAKEKTKETGAKETKAENKETKTEKKSSESKPATKGD
jgi:putative FmdB family regulatory protein